VLASLWNFIYRHAKEYNEERAWTKAVQMVFGHTRWDDLPDTEGDPLDPGWVKVDELMAEYRAVQEQKDQAS